MEKDGCRAICSACGFFGNYHKIVSEALDVPVQMAKCVMLEPGEAQELYRLLYKLLK